MATMAERLIQAWHSHDARWVAALFAEDYLSDQPAHPGRAFTGNEQVLANWTEVFEGVPDFSAELLASSVAGGTEMGRMDLDRSAPRRVGVRDARRHGPGHPRRVDRRGAAVHGVVRDVCGRAAPSGYLCER